MQRKKTNTKQQKARVVSSRVAYRGPVFTVTTDQVIEPSGIKVRRDMVRHSGSVVIMLLEESGKEVRVLLARQYRHPANGFLWEFPAGRIDEGEQTLSAAKRELLEETGYSAGKWKKALFFYSSPGFLDETMTVYLARDPRPGQAQPEDDEVIALRFFTLSAARKMVQSGRIRDAKTIAGLLWLAMRFDPNGRP
jgi:ADP-ribose pyrophosphatase